MVDKTGNILPQLVMMGIWVGAGLSGYIFVFNRWLLRIRDGSLKVPAMGGAALLFLLIPALFGRFTPFNWLLVPCAAYFLVLIDQIRLIHVRMRMKGEPPQQVQALGSSAERFAVVTTTDLHLVRYQIELPAPELECETSLTVAHLSDFHINDRIPMSYYTGAFEQALAESPDLVLLTGDYLSEKRNLSLLKQALEPLKAHPQVYSILGNHDYWAGASLIRPVLAEAGLHLLCEGEFGAYRLGRRTPSWQGKPEHKIPIVRLFGSEEPWGKACQIPADPTSVLDLVLTHTPDNIYHLLNRSETARAVFCGHLHAGQLCFPGNPPVAIFLPSNYGRRFDRRQGLDGHFVFGGGQYSRGRQGGQRQEHRNPIPDGALPALGPAPTHLFVSGGVGSGRPPIRLFCPPDFFLIRFNFLGATAPCLEVKMMDNRMWHEITTVEAL